MLQAVIVLSGAISNGGIFSTIILKNSVEDIETVVAQIRYAGQCTEELTCIDNLADYLIHVGTCGIWRVVATPIMQALPSSDVKIILTYFKDINEWQLHINSNIRIPRKATDFFRIKQSSTHG